MSKVPIARRNGWEPQAPIDCARLARWVGHKLGQRVICIDDRVEEMLTIYLDCYPNDIAEKAEAVAGKLGTLFAAIGKAENGNVHTVVDVPLKQLGLRQIRDNGRRQPCTPVAICTPARRQTITARHQPVTRVDRGILVEDWPVSKPARVEVKR